MGPARTWASSWKRNSCCSRELKLGPSSCWFNRLSCRKSNIKTSCISQESSNTHRLLMSCYVNIMLFTLHFLRCVCISQHGYILFFISFVVGRPKLKFRFTSFLSKVLVPFIHWLTWQQVYSLFQSEFSRECNLVLSISHSSTFPSPSPPSSPSSCLRLLPRLPVPSIFPSMTCFRRRFVRNVWPIQLAFLHFIVCRKFLSYWTPSSQHRSKCSFPS